jgi:hypothetical protein
MLNLDTHILLLALADELKPKEAKLLAAKPWSISAIVLWEVCKLAQLGRIELDVDAPELSRTCMVSTLGRSRWTCAEPCATSISAVIPWTSSSRRRASCIACRSSLGTA